MLAFRKLAARHPGNVDRGGSAIWGLVGLPGEHYPSLMVIRNGRQTGWQLMTTGAFPDDWHRSFAKQLHTSLLGECFQTRREALKAVQVALWQLED